MTHLANLLADAAHDAIVLDFDGVIADSEVFQLAIWMEQFSDLGLVPARTDLPAIAGISDRIAVENLLPGYSDPFYTELVAKKKSVFKANLAALKPVRGVVNFLRKANAETRLAICSNADRETVQGFLRTHALGIEFETICAKRDFTRPKPDPDPYLLVLRELNLSPSACLAIEDSLVGVESATTAGLDVAFYNPFGFHNPIGVAEFTSFDQVFGDSSGELGVNSEGAIADLLLLDGDPLADLESLRNLHGVMARGNWRNRAALNAMLDGVAAAAEAGRSDAVN